jgi:hypothetical protein
MAVLKLKVDNETIHLRIFDEKSECLAEVKGKAKDNKRVLAEIGKSYGYCFAGLKDLIFFLENPKTVVKGIMVGYNLTRDRE